MKVPKKNIISNLAKQTIDKLFVNYLFSFCSSFSQNFIVAESESLKP